MKTAAADCQEPLYCCPKCGGETVPECLESGDELPRGACGHALWFAQKAMSRWTIVRLLTELISERDTVKQVQEVLDAAGDCPRLVLDLACLRFLPGSVLKLLVALQRRLDSNGGALVICGLHPQTYDALRRARLTRLLTICDDPQDLLT